MTTPDDDFDDFLRRRKPLFDRLRAEDMLEPPAELDRAVLRQAREAIELPREQRLYRAPRWTAPLAVAATLAVAFTVVLQFVPKHRAVQPAAAQVALQPAARQVDAADENYIVRSGNTAPDAIVGDTPADDGTVVMRLDSGAADPMVTREVRHRPDASAARDAAAPVAPNAFVSEAEANRHAEAPSTPILVNDAAGVAADSAAARMRGPMEASSVPRAAPAEYRRDEKRWMAEIQRLRAAGDIARADAEYAEFKRQHRALAVSPDR